MSMTEAYGAEKRGADQYMYDPAKLLLVDDPEHPLYDERNEKPVSAELVALVEALGVLVPIIVRKNGEAKDGTPIMEVVDGRQRVRAAREVNKGRKPADRIRVPGMVKKLNGDDSLDVSIAANVRVIDDPITHARKLRRYIDRGHTEKEAAVLFGCKPRAVRDALVLLSCSAKVQRAIEGGRVALKVARDMAAMPEAEQDATLASLDADGLLAPVAPAAAARVKTAKGDRGRLRKVSRFHCRPSAKVAALRSSLRKAAVEGSASSPRINAGMLALLNWVLGAEDSLIETFLPAGVVLP